MSARATEDQNSETVRFQGHDSLSILLGGLRWPHSRTSAMAEQASRERDIVDFAAWSAILVDDGSCPPGEIKEVSGPDDGHGILRVRKCIPRWGRRRDSMARLDRHCEEPTGPPSAGPMINSANEESSFSCGCGLLRGAVIGRRFARPVGLQ